MSRSKVAGEVHAMRSEESAPPSEESAPPSLTEYTVTGAWTVGPVGEGWARIMGPPGPSTGYTRPSFELWDLSPEQCAALRGATGKPVKVRVEV